jgi:branched-subunit amino acid ABC-type transport system permease component
MWVGIPIIFTGFSLGSFYALIALGFSLILGVTRALNLAHGEMIVLSGYLAYVLWQFFQVPFFWILPICSVVLLALTVPLYYLLRTLPEPYGLNTLMVTLGKDTPVSSTLRWRAGVAASAQDRIKAYLIRELCQADGDESLLGGVE